MLYVFLVFAVLALAPVRPAVAAEREPTPQELKEAEAEWAKMRRERPQEYRGMVAMFQMILGAFGFGTGPFDGVLDGRTQAAIRTYQRLRRLPETGTADARTFLALTRDHEAFERKDVNLPPLWIWLDGWEDGYITARGTWIIQGMKSGSPVQTTEIQCNRKQGVCFEAIALYERDGDVLSVVPTIFEIERWDQHEITTRPKQSGACVRYSIRIGRLTRTVTGLRLRTTEQGLCKGMDAELVLRLVDGAEVWKELFKERREKIRGLVQAPGLLGENLHRVR